MKKIRLLLFALPILLWSCEEVLDDINPLSSDFSATVTGDVTTTFSGEANFKHVIAASQDPGASSIYVLLENSTDAEEYINLSIIDYGNKDGITAGTYEYDEDAVDDLLVSLWYTNQTVGFIKPDPDKINKITISSVENTRIKGSYSFNVLDVFGAKALVTGTFDAVGITSTQ